MKRPLIPVALLALLLAGLPMPKSASAEGSTLAARCPAYRAHLLAARAYLGRGDQARALAELRQAQEALEGCSREDVTEKTDVLAANGPRTAAT